MNDDYNILKEWGIIKSEPTDTVVFLTLFYIIRVRLVHQNQLPPLNYQLCNPNAKFLNIHLLQNNVNQFQNAVLIPQLQDQLNQPNLLINHSKVHLVEYYIIG